MRSWNTYNYKELNANPRHYQGNLEVLFGQRALTQALKRRATPVPAKIDLTAVEPLIARAAAEVLAVINEKVASDRHPDNRWCDLFINRPDYSKAKDRVLCQNHDRVMTYTRAFQLLEAGHLDSVEAAVANAVLFRAETTQQWPETLNERGMAQLDMVLKAAAQRIKPLLMKQGSLLQ